MFEHEFHQQVLQRLDRIEALLVTINKQELKMSQALDDLNAAVAAIQTSVTNLQATANTVVADIAALVAAQGQNDDAGVEAAVATLKASGASLDAANSALTAAEPPAPTPPAQG